MYKHVFLHSRMEERSGRHFKKLGYVDVNLSEYAGAGPSTQRYILQAYDSSHRMDNSMIQLSLNITLVEGDIIFSRSGRQKLSSTKDKKAFDREEN